MAPKWTCVQQKLKNFFKKSNLWGSAKIVYIEDKTFWPAGSHTSVSSHLEWVPQEKEMNRDFWLWAKSSCCGWYRFSNIHSLSWRRKPNMVRSKLYVQILVNPTSNGKLPCSAYHIMSIIPSYEVIIFIQKKKNEELLKSHCDLFICSTSDLCTKSYLLPELTLKISISWVWKAFMEEMEVKDIHPLLGCIFYTMRL